MIWADAKKLKEKHEDEDLVFIFNGIENAYCPICDKKRYILKDIGYCCTCGHHLNRSENNEQRI